MTNLEMNLDPRPAVINKRLAGVKRIIAVSGFKGGVGKSSVACILALALAEKGHKTGLLDLDFTGASCHTILGVKTAPGAAFPEEIEGLLPPEIHGVRFMGASYFTENKLVHMRGTDLSNAVIELLSVTNWGGLDYLVLDMPPGFSDIALDVLRFAPRAEALCVAQPGVLSLNLAAAALAFLRENKTDILGIVENMAGNSGMSGIAGAPVLAKIEYDPEFETYIGRPDKLLSSPAAKELAKITF